MATPQSEEVITAAEANRIKGWEAHRINHDLALGMTHKEVAERYGKRVGTISKWSSDHKHIIEQIKREMGASMTHLWISDKEARIAEYQAIAENCRGHIMAIEEAASRNLIGDLPDTDKIGRLHDREMKALNAAAEELGHLPTRNAGEGATVVQLRHEVVGFDMHRDVFGVPESELMR